MPKVSTQWHYDLGVKLVATKWVQCHITYIYIVLLLEVVTFVTFSLSVFNQISECLQYKLLYTGVHNNNKTNEQ